MEPTYFYADRKSLHLIWIHVAFRGNAKFAVFYDDEDKTTLLKFLQIALYENNSTLYEFCIMTNHCHLMLQTECLTKLMTVFLREYSRWHNKKYKLSEKLFGTPFLSAPQYTEDHMKNIMAISLITLAAFVFSGNANAQDFKTVKASDPRISYSGRVFFHNGGNSQDVINIQSGDSARFGGGLNAGRVSFDWIGVHAMFKFTGGYCAVKLSDTGRDYYNVFIDGVLSKVAIARGTDTTVVLAENLSKGPHTLLLQKRTEGEQGMTTLNEFLLAHDGEIYSHSNIKRHILFIGNSLTCGYGTESLSGKEDFFASTENCNKAFGCILARYFHALHL